MVVSCVCAFVLGEVEGGTAAKKRESYRQNLGRDGVRFGGGQEGSRDKKSERLLTIVGVVWVWTKCGRTAMRRERWMLCRSDAHSGLPGRW